MRDSRLSRYERPTAFTIRKISFPIFSPDGALSHEAIEKLAVLVDRAPQANHLAIKLHVRLVEVPASLPEAVHARDALPPNVASEEWSAPVIQHPHCLVADIVAALEQEIFDVPQRQREPHIHHRFKADNLGRGVKVL